MHVEELFNINVYIFSVILKGETVLLESMFSVEYVDLDTARHSYRIKVLMYYMKIKTCPGLHLRKDSYHNLPCRICVLD